MRKLRLVGCLVLLSVCAAVAVPQTQAQAPGDPFAFCVCCYFKFMDAGTFAYFYGHDCVDDLWVGYIGASDTPLAEGPCDKPCPSDCVCSPFSGASTLQATLAIQPEAAPSLAAGPQVYLGKGNAVLDKVRRTGLTEPLDPLQALKLEVDPNSPYDAKLMDECWAKVKLPGGRQLPVKLALVAVGAKLNAAVQEKKGVMAPAKVLAMGWQVKHFPADVKDSQIVNVESSNVIPVGPSGERTHALWISLPAGDFQVLTSTAVKVR